MKNWTLTLTSFHEVINVKYNLWHDYPVNLVALIVPWRDR
ncbi:hypothetical protein FTV88_2059 [Heliorestis convoluta]|uniref:Uncharacterized protein n=1 Tax=Heliorestis convoluta TaxID=356322 RepID=A0A5Q2MZQ1_9FIRM|nr:hypothetical protein FTV88_2059 [Heliorestis convoluta]